MQNDTAGELGRLEPNAPRRAASSSTARPWATRARRGVPIAMSVFLGLYIVMHSPLRSTLRQFLGMGNGRECYFTCQATLPFSQIVNALVVIWLLVVVGLAARIVANRVQSAPYEWCLIFGLAGFALIVVPAAIIGGIAGITNTHLLWPPIGPLLVGAPAAVLGVAYRRQIWLPPRTLRLPRGLAGFVACVALGLILISTITSVLYPPTGFDALAYHAPLAVYLWRDGDLSAFLDRAPWGWAMAHPASAELWYGLLWIAGGEHAANLGQLPFAALGSAAVYAFARRQRMPPAAASVGAWAFLCAPIVVTQIGMQLNDVAAGALVMAVAALASAPPAQWTRGRVGMLGLGLGLAAATKLAALPAVATIALLVGVTLLRQSFSHATRRPALIRLLVFALAFLVVVMPWCIRNGARYGNPIYPAPLPLLGRGVMLGDLPKNDTRYVPSAMTWGLYPVVEPHNERSGYGALFAVGALPGLAYAATRRRRWSLGIYGMLVLVALPTWWLLTPREPRLILILFGLGFAFIPWSLLALRRGWRSGGLVALATAALFSALVTVDQIVLPRMRQPTMRDAFYDQVWGIDPFVAALPERDGLLYHTGYARLSYAGDYFLLGRAQGRVLVSVDAGVTSERIEAIMREGGLRFAYVPAAPEAQAAVERTYAAPRFDLVHVSTIAEGESRGTRRYLYRLR